jgi:hypothetical protein
MSEGARFTTSLFEQELKPLQEQFEKKLSSLKRALKIVILLLMILFLMLAAIVSAVYFGVGEINTRLDGVDRRAGESRVGGGLIAWGMIKRDGTPIALYNMEAKKVRVKGLQSNTGTNKIELYDKSNAIDIFLANHINAADCIVLAESDLFAVQIRRPTADRRDVVDRNGQPSFSLDLITPELRKENISKIQDLVIFYKPIFLDKSTSENDSIRIAVFQKTRDIIYI